MQKDEAVKRRILEAATDWFMKLGWKFTMDDLAAFLGISKKTIYKHFPNKDELLKEVIGAKMCELMLVIQEITSDETMDFLARLRRLMDFAGTYLSRIGVSNMMEIQKNAPEIWKQIETFREKFIYDFFKKFFTEGVSQGWIRSDVNQEIILMLYLGAVRTIVTPETLSRLPLTISEVIGNISDVIFNGILIHDSGTVNAEKEAPQ